MSVSRADGFKSIADAALKVAAADIFVTDVQVSGFVGSEIATRAREKNPELRVIVLTDQDDPDVAVEALRAGATCFITKDTTIEDLVGAIHGCTQDETRVSPRVLTSVLRKLLAAPRPLNSWEERLSGLTAREREVLACMVAGMNRNAIGEALFVSPNTVRTHTQRVLAKLGVHSSLEAVAVALRAGVRPYRRQAGRPR